MVTFILVNSEVQGALAKLVKVLRTHHNDRYDEIYHHWRSKVLDPKI
jgi:hypothetical protein